MKYRNERDSLGEVQVPQEALYSGQTQRAVNNFPISGLRPWRAFIWSMAIIKRAAAEVNHNLGLLDEERAAAIVRAAQEIIDGRWDDQFLVDPFQAGAGTSHNMNVNEVIANRATHILGGALGEYRVHANDQGRKRFDLELSHLGRVTLRVDKYEPPHPLQIAALGGQAILPNPNGRLNLFDKPRHRKPNRKVQDDGIARICIGHNGNALCRVRLFIRARSRLTQKVRLS